MSSEKDINELESKISELEAQAKKLKQQRDSALHHYFDSSNKLDAPLQANEYLNSVGFQDAISFDPTAPVMQQGEVDCASRIIDILDNEQTEVLQETSSEESAAIPFHYCPLVNENLETKLDKKEVTFALVKDTTATVKKSLYQNAKNFATISGHAILGLLPNQIQRYVAGKLYDDKSKAHEISFQSSLVEGTIGTGMLIGTEYSLVTDLLTNHTGGPYVLASMVVFASGFARAALVKSDYSNNSSNGTGHPILGAIYHPCQLAVKTITQYIPNITRAITGKITNIYRNKEQELLSSNETKLLEEENPKSSN